jgi:hypothetical protein
MNYLDANIFIYAFIDAEDKGNRARLLLKKIRKGKEIAATCALTFDEVFWIVNKEKGFDNALEAGKALLEMPNLIFFDVNDEVIWKAYELIKRYRLDPRDSIHLSSALTHGVFTLISEDKDFDRVKEIERKGLK